MYMFTARVQVQSRSQIPNAQVVWRDRVDFRTCISVVNVFSTVRIESIFSTVDDRIERGTNQLDFQKIESMHMHFTWDDRVKRGTNRIDFADHRVDIIAICRRKDSIFESTILKQTAHHNMNACAADLHSSRWYNSCTS